MNINDAGTFGSLSRMYVCMYVCRYVGMYV